MFHILYFQCIVPAAEPAYGCPPSIHMCGTIGQITSRRLDGSRSSV